MGNVLLLLAVAAMFAAMFRVGPGFRRWARGDQITYGLLIAGTLPWLAYGFVAPQPLWLHVVSGVLFARALVVFFWRQIRWLRASEAALARERAELRERGLLIIDDDSLR